MLEEDTDPGRDRRDIGRRIARLAKSLVELLGALRPLRGGELAEALGLHLAGAGELRLQPTQLACRIARQRRDRVARAGDDAADRVTRSRYDIPDRPGRSGCDATDRTGHLAGGGS